MAISAFDCGASMSRPSRDCLDMELVAGTPPFERGSVADTESDSTNTHRTVSMVLLRAKSKDIVNLHPRLDEDLMGTTFPYHTP